MGVACSKNYRKGAKINGKNLNINVLDTEGSNSLNMRPMEIPIKSLNVDLEKIRGNFHQNVSIDFFNNPTIESFLKNDLRVCLFVKALHFTSIENISLVKSYIESTITYFRAINQEECINCPEDYRESIDKLEKVFSQEVKKESSKNLCILAEIMTKFMLLIRSDFTNEKEKEIATQRSITIFHKYLGYYNESEPGKVEKIIETLHFKLFDFVELGCNFFYMSRDNESQPVSKVSSKTFLDLNTIESLKFAL